MFIDKSCICFLCTDLSATEKLVIQNFPCLKVTIVLGHITFPRKWQIDEFVLSRLMTELATLNRVKNCQSPVQLEVRNSCENTVGYNVDRLFQHGLLCFKGCEYLSKKPINTTKNGALRRYTNSYPLIKYERISFAVGRISKFECAIQVQTITIQFQFSTRVLF